MKPFGVLVLLAISTAGFGAGKPAASDEAEDLQMIEQVEKMGKSIQEALAKVAAQMKAGGSSEKETAAAKQNLEDLAKKLQQGQAAMKNGNGSSGRAPGAADGSTSEMMKTLQNFIQGMTSKVIENANQTVDKLNKMADENP